MPSLRSASVPTHSMVCSFLLIVFNLEITHFGKKYTHQDPKKEMKSTEKMDPWNSLDIPIINEIYRQYWLDFVLLGYAIPDIINVQTNISSANP